LNKNSIFEKAIEITNLKWKTEMLKMRAIQKIFSPPPRFVLKAEKSFLSQEKEIELKLGKGIVAVALASLNRGLSVLRGNCAFAIWDSPKLIACDNRPSDFLLVNSAAYETKNLKFCSILLFIKKETTKLLKPPSPSLELVMMNTAVFCTFKLNSVLRIIVRSK